MTNTELLAKIKAEIESLKSIEYPCDNSQQATGFFNALDRMTDFLSTLESEKPMQEGLEVASVELADMLLAKPKDYAISAKADYWNGAHDGVIAGAKWQKEQMISALKNDGDLPIEFIDKFHEIDHIAFQNGQANMREQMMKEAVEVGSVVEEGRYCQEIGPLFLDERAGFKPGEKEKGVLPV